VRGCLGVLLLAVVFVLVGFWLGAPPVAETLVRTALGPAGVRSDDLEVSIRADPPLELALGRASHVVVDGTDVAWDDFHADAVHLVMDDVDLLGRSAARTTGTLTGVVLPGVKPAGSKATVELAGRGPSASVTITIDRSTAEAMATAAFEQRTGLHPSRVTLSAPNAIRFNAGQVDVSGSITVGADGSLGVSTPQGRVTVLGPAATDPIRLTGAAVQGDDLVLTGTVDVASLLS